MAGCHGTILFLICLGFLFQAGSLYYRRFCRVLRGILMRERSKTRLLAICVRCVGYRGCSVVLSPLSIYVGENKSKKRNPEKRFFSFFCTTLQTKNKYCIIIFFTKSPSMYTDAPSPEKTIFLEDGASVHRQRKSNLN